MHVTLLEDIILENIHISKLTPSYIFGNHKRDIFYKHGTKKENLTVQFPCSQVYSCSFNHLSLCFSSIEENSHFVKKLESLISSLRASCERANTKTEVGKLQWHPNCKKTVDGKFILQCKWNSQNMPIFDQNQEQIQYNNASHKFKELKGCVVESIIQISYVSYCQFLEESNTNAIETETYDCILHLDVLQLKTYKESHVYHHAFIQRNYKTPHTTLNASDTRNTCAIANVRVENIENKNTFENHAIFGKYFKMLLRGIPKGAVEQKIKMEGHDPSILTFAASDNVPDYLSTQQNRQNTVQSIGDVFKQQSENLSKTEVLDRKSYHKKESRISLEEILAKLSSLRKITKRFF